MSSSASCAINIYTSCIVDRETPTCSIYYGSKTKPLRCKKQNLEVKGGGERKMPIFFSIFQIFNFFIAQKVKENDSGITGHV